MNMFANLMGSLVDKEAITRETIKDTLENLSEEYNCSPTKLFIMIKAKSEDSQFQCWVYNVETGKCIREITLKEILGIEEEKQEDAG